MSHNSRVASVVNGPETKVTCSVEDLEVSGGVGLSEVVHWRIGRNSLGTWDFTKPRYLLGA